MNFVQTDEIEQIIYDSNETSHTYIKERSIINDFEIQSEKKQDKVALIYNNEIYTYADLCLQMNKVACGLIHIGIKENDVIGIYMEKSDRYLITILGILKCGCTYLPLDKVYPASRIERMIEISNARYVIVEDVSAEENNIGNQSSFIHYKDLYTYNTGDVSSSYDGSSPAYIIFTSGSTGDPKGIPIKHYSIRNLVNAMTYHADKAGANNYVGLLAPMVFDMSVAQMYYALLNGKTLVIIPDDIKTHPGKLLGYMRDKKIDICDITPQHLYMLIRYIKHTGEYNYLPNIFFCAGEALPLATINELYALDNTQDCVIINSYGPAEACVYVSFYVISKELAQHMKQVLIGKPMFNTNIYLLDDRRNLCPIDVEGELCISGDGLTSGYLMEHQLTRDKFIVNPWKEKEMLYRTGDIAKWTNTGDIICLGRKDNQVKVRGYRIELEEIEYRLNEIKEIEQSKVIVDKKTGKDVLVAYFTATQRIALGKIRNLISKYLPNYMMPNYYVRVEQFDVNINGKVDVRKLPDYEIYAIKEVELLDGDEPDLIERELLKLCRKIIRYNMICIRDNFFQVGGDSLSLIDLSIQIFDIWKVSVDISSLYGCETIRNMADLIKEKANEWSPVEFSVRTKNEREEVKATDFQKLIFKYEKQSDAKRKLQPEYFQYPSYNIIQYITVNQHLARQELFDAVEKVVNSQSAFKITFHYHNNEYYIKENEINCEGYFEYIDCQEALTEEYVKGFARKFNIHSLPLLQFCLFENHRSEQVILLNIHHSIFDYTSLSVFLNDIFKYYTEKRLPQTGDYVAYMRAGFHEPKVEYYEFWREYLCNRTVCTFFYPDKNCDNIRVKKEDQFTDECFKLSGERLNSLRRISKQIKVSEYIILISSLALLLGIYCSNNDVILGAYLPGRDYLNNRMIGFFTHMVGIRFKLEHDVSLRDFIDNQNKNFLELMKNKSMDYTHIYKALEYNDLIKGELFSVIFNYVHQHRVTVKDMTITADDISEEPQVLPLSIKAFEDDEKIIFKIKYAVRLYSKKYIRNIGTSYCNMINQIINRIDDTNILIKDILEQNGGIK